MHTMPPKIPLPTDEELTPEHRELLAKLPPLNVFRMVAGAPRALQPFMQLGGAVLSTALDPQRREIAVLSRFLESTRVAIEDEALLGDATAIGRRGGRITE